jgi:iron(III) transport system substrate-binding protein
MKVNIGRSKRFFLVLGGLVLIALLVAACGAVAPAAAPTEAAAEVPAATEEAMAEVPAATEEAMAEAPAATEEAVAADMSLAEAAEAEGGQLMIYTSMNIDDLEVVLAEFKKAYPFVSTEYYRASGEDVIAKAVTEAQGGQNFADVFETNAFEVYRLMQEGLLEAFDAPERAAYPDNAKDTEGYWTVDRINLVVIAYNTDLVDAADVPKTHEDLLDPKWKGKIAVEPNDVELLADMVGAWGEEKTKAFWGGIAAQEPRLVDGHTELAEFMVAGEFAISPTVYGHRVVKLKGDGAPIEWVITDPAFAFTQLLALAKDAPHPATGKLFVNWLLSEEGQKVIQSLDRVPARPGVDDLLAGMNVYYTIPSLAENYNNYLETWQSLGLSLE